MAKNKGNKNRQSENQIQITGNDSNLSAGNDKSVNAFDITATELCNIV